MYKYILVYKKLLDTIFFDIIISGQNCKNINEKLQNNDHFKY